jgi:hypothetical protein
MRYVAAAAALSLATCTYFCGIVIAVVSGLNKGSHV